MKFTAIKDNLTSGLSIVQRALSTKSVQPILSGIYLSAKNGHLTMVATDTIENAGLRIQCTVPVEVLEEGETVVSGKSFREFVSRLPDTNLLFENTSYNGQDKMTIHYDGNATEMIGWPGYDFPKPPQMEILHCMSISQQTLSDLVRQTSFAARKEDLRPIFTGLLFEVSGNDVTVVGTDSFRLAMMEEKVNNETGDDFHVVIPVRALQELIGIVDEDAIIHISVTKNQILFESGDVQMTSQLIKGEFPPYRAALPKAHTTHFDIDRTALKSSIERATLFGRDNSGTTVIRLNVEGGKLKFYTPEEASNGYFPWVPENGSAKSTNKGERTRPGQRGAGYLYGRRRGEHSLQCELPDGCAVEDALRCAGCGDERRSWAMCVQAKERRALSLSAFAAETVR